MIYALIFSVIGILTWSFFNRRRFSQVSPEALIIDPGVTIPSEHVVTLQGGRNFRDLGGYTTADGRQVRWGRVYRSGTLSELTPEDWQALARMEIKLICDLRSENEKAAEPVRLPDGHGAQVHNFPFYYVDSTPMQRLRILLFNPAAMQMALPELYTRYLLDQNPKIFGDVLRFAAEPENLPMIFHCTAGKDRTGLTAALLLLVLGVPEETVIADYTLSNRSYTDLLKYAARVARPLIVLGVRATDLSPLLVADARNLRFALEHLKTKYGSVEAYLREKADLDDETIRRLKDNLLR